MKMAVLAVVLVLLAAAAVCADPILNVHIVPHSHDDVGWLKTVDEYYYGFHNEIQHAGVQYILDSVVRALLDAPDRKFIEVEIAFFWRWWRVQTPAMQAAVRKLVARGQLEFINGGWCMNDEATTTYSDIVDQFALGHDFLMETFGVAPSIGWHIDPFGHSSAQAAIMAQMGYDAFFFSRIDYQDKAARISNREMEFVWRGSESLGAAGQIFTGVTYNHYSPPPGFCFDSLCSDTPIQDDPSMMYYNVEERVSELMDKLMEQAAVYRTNNIMLLMGEDFNYEDAGAWFKNLDKLIRAANELHGDKVRLFYSTPSAYVAECNKAPVTWSVKTDDLFPYADGNHSYWTGYFVSRPALKGYVRKMSAYLRSCRLAEVILERRDQVSRRLWEELSVAQHHDAVAGTEKQAVAYDYALRLSIGEAQCDNIMKLFLQFSSKEMAPLITLGDGSNSDLCKLRNETICAVTQGMKTGDTVVATMWNSLYRAQIHNLLVPIPEDAAVVATLSGQPLACQLSHSPALRNDSSATVAVLDAVTLNPLGSADVIISDAATPDSACKLPEESSEAFISNTFLTAKLDANGRLASVHYPDGTSLQVSQELMYYVSSTGPGSTQKSGAYIFRPNATTPFAINSVPTFQVFKGPVMEEVVLTWAPWAVQRMRLYRSSPALEFDFQIGPIPDDDFLGREIVSRFTGDFGSDGSFATDANGRDIIKRKLNTRFSWNYEVQEPVSGNYAPINTFAQVLRSDGTPAMAIAVDRSVGGGSVDTNTFEIMVHRRTLWDDSRGVGEPISEPGENGQGLIIRTSHQALFGPHTSMVRLVAQQLSNPPDVLFTKKTTPKLAKMVHIGRPRVMQEMVRTPTPPLPPFIHVDAVQVLSGNDGPLQLRVRLAHMLTHTECDSEAECTSASVSVLAAVPPGVCQRGVSVREMALTGNRPLDEVHRMTWHTADATELKARSAPPYGPASQVDPANITMAPMQLRTFLIVCQH